MMDEPLYEVVNQPDLVDPVLVVCLDGWIDAGLGAAGALAQILETVDTQLVARFDTEELVDHRSRRPVMHLVEGVNTGLTWPNIELRHGQDAGGRDLLVLVGAEPDLRWRGFARDVVDLVRGLGTGLVLGIGAYPAPVPHTRPARLAVTATSSEWADRLAEVRATLDVPAGAEAAIERRCAELGLTAVGLWAQVPHYVMTMAYPAASALLLDSVNRIASVDLDTSPLHEAAANLRTRLDALVADNEEHVEMVRMLEESVDAAAAAGTGPGAVLPSGDQLAAEFQRFLRSVDRGETDP